VERDLWRRSTVAWERGQVVLAGSLPHTVEARASDQFHVDYGPLGSFFCQFV
jgi:2-keto-4-pentenoate hydratase